MTSLTLQMWMKGLALIIGAMLLNNLAGMKLTIHLKRASNPSILIFTVLAILLIIYGLSP